MRHKRYLVAVGAVALLAAGGLHAVADPVAPSSEPDSTASQAVRLPTGDIAVLADSGSLMWLPAKGREDVRLVTPPALDGSGDVIAIPSDVLGDLTSGKQDPRRYNVSELLRAGQTDAATAKTLSDKEYGGLVPVGEQPDFDAADAQEVTVVATDAEGKPDPAGSIGLYLDVTTGEAGDLEFDESGKAVVSLPPGTYNFAASAGTVLGGKTVEVADAPVTATLDGTASQPIEYHLDQPADLTSESVDIDLFRDETEPLTLGVGMAAADGGLRVIPTGESDQGIGFETKPKLSGTEGDRTYDYELSFMEKEGIPATPEFTARDEDLAEVTRRYDGIASEVRSGSCSTVVRDGGSQLADCAGMELPVPGEYTRYLSAGPDLTWEIHTSFVAEGDEDISMIGFVGAERFEPGPVERVSAVAPLGLHMAQEGAQLLSRDGDQMSISLPYMENASPDETVLEALGGTGTVRMTKDGTEVGKAALPEGVAQFRLPDKDSGHYTVEAEVGHEGLATPLATKTTMVWEFDSEFTDAPTSLPVSAVNVNPEGVSNGYAEAGADQDFRLDYVAQEGAPDTDLTDLTFEVSYDDGENWQGVDVAVDGDSATGTMRHPGDAKFVALRMSATDADGNKVTQTTLRAMALK